MASGRLGTSLIVNIAIIITLLVVIKTDLVAGSKILIIIPLTTVSEKNAYIPLASALGDRGHNVTVASRFKSSYSSKNVNEVIAMDMKEYLALYSDPMEMRRQGWWLMINMDYEFNAEGCEKVYQNPNFQQLRKEKFDVIITNSWFQQCLHGFIYEQQTPFIMLATMPLMGYTQDSTGSRIPNSFVPNPLVSVKDDMNFGERMFNFLFEHYLTYYTINHYNAALEAVYKKYLGSDLPTAAEIEKNVSIIFSNTHISSTTPRPLMPEIVEVGGMHCRPPKPLPKDLQDYLDGSGDEGFVYFSLGSVIQGKNMPDEWRKMFLNVFSRLKQRVLWKWETETMEGLPPNVKLGKWLPQQDILGHPKIKLFISHGGMFSTQEAIYHGVPILGVPIFVDQNMNTYNMQKNGYGQEIEFLDLTEEKFEKAVRELLTNASYSQNAKIRSSIFRDQLQTPIERAVYWIEYVIRHKGAHHLRSAARNLNFIQYHCLDVIAALLLALITILGLTFIIARKVIRLACRKVCGNAAGNNSSTKKTQ